MRKSDWIYSYSLRGLDEAWNSEGIDRQNDYLLPGISLSQRLHGGSLVNPASGFSHWYRAEAGGANVGSDIDLVRLTANFGLIHSLGEKHRFVLRSNLGAAFVEDADRGQLAPSLNFFAGGAQSIRGYGYQSIGNEVTVENATGNPVSLIVGGDRLLTAVLSINTALRRTGGAQFLSMPATLSTKVILRGMSVLVSGSITSPRLVPSAWILLIR